MQATGAVSRIVLATCLCLVRLAAGMAPGSHRSDWRAEWEAEIVHRWMHLGQSGKLSVAAAANLIWRSAGAVVHAAWLRKTEWRVEIVSQDIRYALRGLIKRPLFTTLVVVTVGLGIGANTAIFSVVNGLILTPLPFDDPDHLVMVWEHNIPRSQATNVVSPANFFTWREENTVFEGMSAALPNSITITGDGEPERIGVVLFTPGLFELLRVSPHMGRVIVEDDVEGPPVVMLNHGFWRRRFGNDRDVIGRSIELNGTSHRIVGVLPAGFEIDLPYDFNSTGSQDVFRLLPIGPESRNARGRWMQVIARLKQGVSVATAQAQMSGMASRLEQEFPEFQSGWDVNVVSMHRQVVGSARTPVLILFGAVILVLLISCANVANLLLSRASGRHQELAVRTALGAGRLRLIRQLLTENLILGVAGGAIGLLLAYWAVSVLVALEPDIPRLDRVGIDGTVLSFTIAISLLTGLVFGLVPALKTSSLDLSDTLKEGGTRGAVGGHEKTRASLVVAEIALSLMLLVGAGLLLRSFANLLQVGVGFDVENVIAADVQLSGSRYQDAERRVQVFEEIVASVNSIPGVTSASAITWLPLAGGGSATTFWANDRDLPEQGEFPVADVRWIHQGFHQTMKIPLIAGRYFDEQDVRDGPLRVVVSEYVQRTFWPNESALGKTISMPWGDTLVAEIIGVVGDIRHMGPDIEPRSMFYWHHKQFTDFGFMSIVARTTGDALSYASAVRGKVQALDSNLPIYRVTTMQSYLGDSVAQARFVMISLAVFALLALILAAIGIYGVMSYSVSQRTREFGIRMALGAEGREVASDVVRRGLVLVGLATVIGLVGAISLSRIMRGMVFEISTSDPLTLVGVSLFLAAVALAACYLPARRASKVDPIEALRQE
ncbi:MAG: ABC transporter permease [Gemmatimonadota bacterium]|nr:MAG: ABC transporter permease [Gemmatimonadota bacterium]